MQSDGACLPGSAPKDSLLDNKRILYMAVSAADVPSGGRRAWICGFVDNCVSG